MKNFSKSKIMRRAWEIKKSAEKESGMKAEFAICLKMAWAEAKAPKACTKKDFNKYAKIGKKTDADAEIPSQWLYFKYWIKGSKKRVYVSDYKRRTVGFIDINGFTLIDRQGCRQDEIEYAVKSFESNYSVDF